MLAGAKRSRDPAAADGSAGGAAPEAKAIKLEDGAAPAATARPPAADGEDNNWVVPIPVAGQAVHFLLRLVLTLLGNAPDAMKDNQEELRAAQKYAIALIGRAVRVWPNIPVKAQYIEHVVPPHMSALMNSVRAEQQRQAQLKAQQQGQQQPGQPLPPIVLGPMPCPPPPPALTVSLSVMKVLLSVQSPHLLQAAHSQVSCSA